MEHFNPYAHMQIQTYVQSDRVVVNTLFKESGLTLETPISKFFFNWRKLRE